MKSLLAHILYFAFSLSSQAELLTGIDILEKNNFDILKGRRVGLIINHTSLDRNGRSDVDVMIDAGVDIRAIFSPEHGFMGNEKAGADVLDSSYRGISVYSLYGKNKRPDDKMLENIDTLVFDIQDVGARFYTYLTTMGYAMEEAAKKKIRFIVLDRPNPISSSIMEGPVLDDDIKAFTAYFAVPVRHSLTAGEMAIFHKIKSNIDLELYVVRMEGYKRDMFFDETSIKWVNPSPNIRNLNTAILYPGIGCFEATNISVGRGTDIPFEFFGSPWLDNSRISDELNKRKLKGVEFKPCYRVPSEDLYAGEVVNGVCIKVTDKRKVRAFDIFVNAIYLINAFYPDKLVIREREITLMTGSKDFYLLLKNGATPKQIVRRYNKALKDFKKYLKKNNIKLY
ncbi:MAG: exo-beta-N-acetylmuramidase NamZ family protein [Elusimicrobiales bacterium]